MALYLASAAPGVIPLALILPFILLLALIAVMPLMPAAARHWWERYYGAVALTLAAGVAGYYLLRIPAGASVLAHTVAEYVSFICLIGSLFVVASGIHLRMRGAASPGQNVVFLAVGALATNVIGTTGASMLLIRPWIRTNQDRLKPYHVVFFIFIISNIGGSLTPIGDPPLFLGYLRGVPFFWLLRHAVVPWAAVLATLLIIFYIIDRRGSARSGEPPSTLTAPPDFQRFEGRRNLIFLAVIIAAVFLPSTWFLRESVMGAAALASYWLTPERIHRVNEFSFFPIREVAFLFAGIFVTMMPALGYLEQHGRSIELSAATEYYFSTGILSAVLDNAPTYVNFLKLAEVTARDGQEASEAAASELPGVEILLRDRPDLVLAVSLGAVFFGAMTYIGNGPNFMVRSIASGFGVAMPSFFGYLIKYSLPILLPVLIACGLLLL